MLLAPEFEPRQPATARGRTWQLVFLASTIVGILALTALLLNILDSAFGYVAYEAKVDPATLAVDGIPLEEQTKDQLVALLQVEALDAAHSTS